MSAKPMENGLVKHPYARVSHFTEGDGHIHLLYFYLSVVRCGDLPDPKFGSVSLSGEVFGSTATYSCRKGYLLVGRRTRTCQANGQWSGKAPVCRSKHLHL